MKVFNKAGFILFVSLMMGLFLAGCAGASDGSGVESNSAGDSDKETVEFVYWAAAGGEEEAFLDMIEDFEEKNPDIDIKANQVPPPSSGDYYTKIQTRIAADDSPDVFRIQYQKFGEFASEGALLDVTDLFESEKENYNPSLLTAVTSESKIYGLPHHTDTLAVFYNKTYLDELGIEAPSIPEEAWTWEEFIDVASKIEDAGLADSGIAVNWSETSAYRALPFFFQNGATILNEDSTQGNVDTPEAIESFTFLQDMFKNHMTQGNSMKGSDDFNMLFSSGNVGLLISGNWMIPKYESDMKDFEWGVTYMPIKESAASDLGGNGMAIPAASKHSEAAKKFLSYMGEPEVMKAFVEKGLFLPARTDITEPFNYAIEDQEMLNLFIEQSQTVPEELAETVTTNNFSKINQALGDTLEELFISNTTPENAANSFNERINSILEEN
ncbi:sugar ABC transporter substrate-binding protein [Oceanobacillus sp. Castelsardo]|uniref:ABC transporter substrate-binding protein n=1 Tax=Oceanobacillus sp. Castelsardo TaxID=1851204 RepID=UPI0012E76BFF|nr:sugar ABC transporter substrate-binding protein [Oceanobacillus sp. Castelsardo]